MKNLQTMLKSAATAECFSDCLYCLQTYLMNTMTDKRSHHDIDMEAIQQEFDAI